MLSTSLDQLLIPTTLLTSAALFSVWSNRRTLSVQRRQQQEQQEAKLNLPASTKKPKRYPIRVSIIGTGVAGLTLARALSMTGKYKVKLFERSATLSPAIGGGFSIQSGLIILKNLGFSQEDLEANFKPIIHLDQYTADGSYLGTSNINHAIGEDGLKVGGILRAELMELLSQNLDIQLAKEVKSVEQDLDRGVVKCTFTDGTVEESDLLVGCDGINSTVRRLVFGDDSEPIYSGHASWYGVARVDKELYDRLEHHMILQAGQGFSTLMYCSGTKGNVIFSKSYLAERPKKETWDNIEQEASKHIEEFTQGIAEPFPTIAKSAIRLMHFGKYYRNPLKSQWHQGNVVLVGDAAHPILPYMGQGANLAMEDACLLAKLLSDDTLSFEEAFQMYFKKRSPKTAKLFNASAKSGSFQFANNALSCFVRNTLYKLAYMFRWNEKWIAGVHQTMTNDVGGMLLGPENIMVN